MKKQFSPTVDLFPEDNRGEAVHLCPRRPSDIRAASVELVRQWSGTVTCVHVLHAVQAT